MHTGPVDAELVDTELADRQLAGGAGAGGASPAATAAPGRGDAGQARRRRGSLSRGRPSPGRRADARSNLLDLALALLCAAGLTTAFLPWSSLTQVSEHTGPVLLCTLLVALTSTLLRALGQGAWVTVPCGLLVGLTVPLHLSGAGPLPLRAGLDALADALTRDLRAVQEFSVPIAIDGGSLSVLITVLALGLALLLEICVVGRGWVALGGFVLLVVHVLPSNFNTPANWLDFTLTASIFIGMLAVGQARESRMHGPDPEGRLQGLRVRAPAVLAVGAAAATAACLVTVMAPLPDAPPWSGSRSGGSDEEVTIANPLLDLRRDLTRGADVDLLTVTGPRRMPRYLRTSVLTDYDGRQWTTGDRRASSSQVADGRMSGVLGLDADTPLTGSDWTFQAEERFRSRWLPLPEHVTTVEASGDWRYDISTRDFVAWDPDLTTSALGWSASTQTPEVSATALDTAPNSLPADGKRWVRLPDGLPDLVGELAQEVAGDAPTRFRQAKALQNWFRSEFTYSLEVVESVGDDDLVTFLSPGGREGYCEQFAASMALMARSLDIPARVVVGFLEPERVNRSTYVFSAHDLHAWPELYFEGAGWVRFEPTPSSRADGVPSYTRTALDGEDDFPVPSLSPAPRQAPSPAPSNLPSGSPSPTTDPGATSSSSGRAGSTSVLAIGALVLLLASGAVPGLLRGRRRASRLSSPDPEQWWEELRSSVVDLGGAWPTGRSPQESRAWLLASDLSPDQDALDTLVRAVELDRYAPSSSSRARTPVDPTSVEPSSVEPSSVDPTSGAAGGEPISDERQTAQHAARTLVETLGSELPRSRRMAARWAPRSLFLGR